MARPTSLNVIVGFVTLLIVSVPARADDDFWKATGSQAAVATGRAESADVALAVLIAALHRCGTKTFEKSAAATLKILDKSPCSRGAS